MVGNRIAIIPARGGSKRLPRKNLIEFKGKPLLALTIDAAIASGLFDQVLVSTEDAEIAEIARTRGAAVPFLRDGAFDDYAPVSAATITALHQAQAHWGQAFHTVVQLMPNCPLRRAADIQDAVGHFEDSGLEFQISCFKYGWMNPWWATKIDGEGRPTPVFAEALGKRSQDLEELYCPTGAIWIARGEALCEAGSFYGPGHRYYPMSWVAAMDIDDESDLQMARALADMAAGGTWDA